MGGRYRQGRAAGSARWGGGEEIGGGEGRGRGRQKEWKAFDRAKRPSGCKQREHESSKSGRGARV